MGLSILLAGGLCFLLLYGRVPTGPLAVVSVFLCVGYILLNRRHGHAHDGLAAIDAHAQRSRLARWNPALKVVFATACVILCVAADSIILSLLMLLLMVALTVAVAGTPGRYYLSLAAIPLVFILLGTVAILIEISPAPLGLLDLTVGRWFLSVTAAGQLRALRVLCKAAGAVSCLYFLSLTTPMHQIIAVLRRAKIPAVVVELMYLIYRYIFIMAESWAQMKVAARSRFGYRGLRVSLRTGLQCARNLMFVSLRRSSDCFAAMESRCYDGEIRFLEQTPALRAAQVCSLAGSGAVTILLWLLLERGIG